MKTKVLSFLFLFAAMLSFNGTQAQSTLIHYWHFNNTLPVGGAGGVVYDSLASDFSAFSSAYIRFKALPGAGSDTGFVDNNLGDTINARMSAVAGNSIRARNPSDKMVFDWHIPTTGYKNIKISYDVESSSTASGQHRQLFSYSVDGTNFITTGLTMTYDSAGTLWGKVVVDLSAITTINDNSKFIFRIVFSAPNTAAKGNTRYDNIAVDAIPLNGSTSVVNVQTTLGNQLYPNPAKENIQFTSATEGSKMITISNVLGQVVNNTQYSGSKLNIDISALENGIYFLNVKDNNGSTSVVRFIKE